MKKRYFAFLTALLIVCCGAQAALAKPQFTNFKQWVGKDRDGYAATFYEFTVIDRNWEVSNKTIYISLYDNKRRLIPQGNEAALSTFYAAVGRRREGPVCTEGIRLTDSNPNYYGDYVKYSNGKYRVRSHIQGRRQIASYQMQWY